MQFTRTSLFLCAAIAALSSADAAFAQAKATQDDDLLDAIVVTGTRDDADQAGGSVQRLDSEQLRTFAYSDVNRVLRAIPGVALQEEDGFGLRPNIGIRGSGTDRSARIVVMEDGILAAPAPYAAPAAYYFPRMARMSAVEVAKGPAAIKYGPSTIGGAINLFSTPISTKGVGEVMALGEALAGNYGGRRLHGAVGGWQPLARGIEIGAMVEGLYEASDGFKRIDSGGPTGFRINDMVAKLALRSGDGRHVVALKYQSYDEHSDETYLGLTLTDFAANPHRRYNASQRDRMTVDHSTYQLSWRSQLGDAVDLTTIAYRTDTARLWYKLQDVRNAANTGWSSMADVLADPAANPVQFADLVGAPGYTGRAGALRVRANDRRYRTTGVQSVLGADFATGGLAHRLELSARYHADYEDRLQQEDRYRMVDGRMVLTSAGVRGTQDNRRGDARAWAFFVQDRIEAGPVVLTPGLRYETIELEQTRWALGDLTRATPVANARRRVDVLIPGIGAVVRLTDTVRLVGGAHHGFAAPAPGSTIDPETSWNYEAGVRLGDGDWRLEAIGFLNDYRNLVGTCTASTGVTCDLGEQFDGGKARATGVEVSGGYTVPLGGNWRAPLALAYTHTRARFGTSFASSFFGTVTRGDRLPYLPANQLTLTGGIDAGAAQINASVNYVDATRGFAGSGAIPAAERIDARTLLDLSGEVDVTPAISAYATVQNLFDTTYNVAFSPAGARPGAPRLVLAGLRARF
ncbi:TonB-dependent receptor family protein [Sphingomonas panni]|uniref:TonB-dependent receptor family protein n=1 Tax=Sphingomonas panni TaxID=237612 RepID=UPI001F5B2DFD|nr:TonB-dependent receptor [Sphingomonas panni]